MGPAVPATRTPGSEWWIDPDARGYYFMGKDNIVFHSRDLAGDAARAQRRRATTAARPGRSGELRLPDEVVSSEYLTMSGSKFSTSRGKVIYVGDFLREFGPDALRYFIAVAGPETTDTDFTWDEFVRRTNFELANEWGNLVNRSISMAHKNNGAIPAPDDLRDIDHALLATSAAAFDAVGALLGAQPVQAGHRRGDAGGRRRPTSTCPTPSRGSSKDDPARRDTVLHTALQVVSDANTLLTPFLPHAAQKVHEALGGDGGLGGPAGDPARSSEEGGPDYPVLMGDYAARAGPLGVTPIEPGRPLVKPTPLFTKLDESLGETGPDWAPILPAEPGVVAAGPARGFGADTLRSSMDLPEPLLALLRGASPCFVSTLMPDGSPQLTQTWVDTDGTHVVINTVRGPPEGPQTCGGTRGSR